MDTGLDIRTASKQLGISVDAVRKRIRQGKLKGYKATNGSWRVVLDGWTPVQGAGQDKLDTVQDAGVSEVTKTDLLEIQWKELNRLLRENERLNGRMDTLVIEISELRQIHQRERVLRQQQQNTLDTLMERIALPTPSSGARVSTTPPPSSPASSPNTTLRKELNETRQEFELLKKSLAQLIGFLDRRL